MSHIHLQDLPALMKKCKEAIKSASKNDMNDTFHLLTDLHEILYRSLEECRDGTVPPPPKALNLESRLDLAAQYVYSFDVGPAVRSDLPMWTARVTADKVGSAGATFTHDAEAPSDALSLALADAAAWTKAQRDIK